jgi:hypothetical protein
MKTIVITLIILIGIVIVIAKYKVISITCDLKQTVKYYDTTYLRKQGGTQFNPMIKADMFNDKFINYDLRSWDAGKNWYAVEYFFDTKELKILGEAEKIYPGLLKHLEAWDRLTEYIEIHGPYFDPTNPEDLKVLEDAGFEVILLKDSAQK